MKSKIQKWGNSLAVRIPSAYVREAGVSYGSRIELSMINGNIVIEPRPESTPSLEDLLAAVSPDNRHDEIDSGEAQGVEVW